MARKKKHEEHENHERWLVSYADFITLLFAFFVVMYSISSVNEGKYRVLSEVLVAAFRSPPKSVEPIQLGEPLKAKSPTTEGGMRAPADPVRESPTNIPMPSPRFGVDNQGQQQARAMVMKQIASEIEKAMKPLIDQDLIVVRRDNLWLEVEIKTNILFPSGSATLDKDARVILKSIADILGKHDNPIHVEGFTDTQPITTTAFPSNWELSAARAASVVHLFSDVGIKPDRMAAVGFGEFRPIADNKTAEGRAKNRRVVLVIMADGNARRPRDQATAAPDLAVQPAAPVIAPTPVPAGRNEAPAEPKSIAPIAPPIVPIAPISPRPGG